jgi:large subunit ribosomal protein L25
MALIELAGRTRRDRGKGAAHRLRAEGYLPGVVYGPGGENALIAVESRSFEKVLRRATQGTVLIDLKLEEGPGEGLKVLIKEVQRHPATSEAWHVDFLHISLEQTVRLTVPVRVTGTADGVKNEGGFLDHVLRELEVECLPLEAPDYIEVDVSPLGVGQSIHAGDVAVERVRVVTPGDRVIVAVLGRQAVAEEVAPAAAVAAEGAAAEAAEEGAAEGEGEKS